MTNLESCGVLEFPNTLESKLNIETMSPSSDTLIPSAWELGRKWLYLERENLTINMAYTHTNQCNNKASLICSDNNNNLY